MKCVKCGKEMEKMCSSKEGNLKHTVFEIWHCRDCHEDRSCYRDAKTNETYNEDRYFFG